MVADLEAEIERVKARAVAKKAKAAPEGKPFLAAVKAVDKATVAAKDADNQAMVEALETIRDVMGEQLNRMGVAAPTPRPRKAKGQAA